MWLTQLNEEFRLLTHSKQTQTLLQQHNIDDFSISESVYETDAPQINFEYLHNMKYLLLLYITTLME